MISIESEIFNLIYNSFDCTSREAQKVADEVFHLIKQADIFSMLKEFHDKFNCYQQSFPRIPPKEVSDLRIELIREEFQDELIPSIESKDLIGISDALGDLLYVVIGAGLAFGIPLLEVVIEIHKSNMSKLGLDGYPVIRDDGKILKGPNYSPPDIKSIIGDSK